MMRRFFLLFFLAKKGAPEHQNALEPKELLWIPNAKSQWKHMETMQPKQCNIEQSLGGIRDRSRQSAPFVHPVALKK